jgi:hypothetical protein
VVREVRPEPRPAVVGRKVLELPLAIVPQPRSDRDAVNRKAVRGHPVDRVGAAVQVREVACLVHGNRPAFDVVERRPPVIRLRLQVELHGDLPVAVPAEVRHQVGRLPAIAESLVVGQVVAATLHVVLSDIDRHELPVRGRMEGFDAALRPSRAAVAGSADVHARPPNAVRPLERVAFTRTERARAIRTAQHLDAGDPLARRADAVVLPVAAAAAGSDRAQGEGNQGAGAVDRSHGRSHEQSLCQDGIAWRSRPLAPYTRARASHPRASAKCRG